MAQWYRLNQDVTFNVQFYDLEDREIESKTVTYKRGSYVDSLEQDFEYCDNWYSCTRYIPTEAVDKIDFDPSESKYFNLELDEFCYIYWKDEYLVECDWNKAIKTTDVVY